MQKKITPGVRITNDAGAWAELKYDPSAGYVPGLGAQGAWYARVWSPDFRNDAPPMDESSTPSRAKAERMMRNWLANRPLSPEECAAFDAAH